MTEAVLSEACTVFDRSKTGIVGSNPARGMDVCLNFLNFVLSYAGRGLAMSQYPAHSVLPNASIIQSFKS
jgi:hypothetical protein